MALRLANVRDLPAEARSSRGLASEAGSGVDGQARPNPEGIEATHAAGAPQESPAKENHAAKKQRERTTAKAKGGSNAGNSPTPGRASSKRTHRNAATKSVGQRRRTKETKAITNRRTGEMSGGGGRRGHIDETPKRGWLNGSPLAIITLALTLALNIGQFGYIYASILGQIGANKTSIDRLETYFKVSMERNEKDDRERHSQLNARGEERYLQLSKSVDDRISSTVRMLEERNTILSKSIDRLDTSINNMLQLKTDVEVMKNKLTGIDETLRRVERSWERSDSRALGIPPANAPAGGHHMGRVR